MQPVVPHSMLAAAAANSSVGELLLWLVPVAASILILALTDRAVAALRAARQRRRAARERPGSNPLRPLPVGNFEEIARRLPSACRCGATQHKVFEGPAPARLRRLWLVIETCPSCGARQRTYFDVTRARGDAPSVGAPPLTPVPR